MLGLVATMLVASHASAEENATSPPGVEPSPPQVVQPTIMDRVFGERSLGDIARELLSRFVDEQRAEFDRVAERYTRLVEFTKRLEARDEAEFEARAARYEKLRAFTRKLEVEQAEREARDFEARVDLVLREQAFTRELERRRAQSAGPTDIAPGPAHWPLYERD
jgi:hypothetical protein